MRKYLSNIKNNKKWLFEEAIRISGRTDIHIDDDPMPYWGYTGYISYNTSQTFDSYVHLRKDMIGSYFSIYVDNSNSDCSDFWKVVDKLRLLKEWKVYEILSEDD